MRCERDQKLEARAQKPIAKGSGHCAVRPHAGRYAPGPNMSLVKVIPLGGVGEIGKNCTAVVQGDDIVVVDCGLSFPHEEQYGVDIVVPDFSWLIENKDKIRGLFLTHAHEDHVGGIPYLLDQLNVPIYATAFTEAMVRSKLQEKRRLIEPKVVRMEFGKAIKAGGLAVEPIRVTHSIPESCALAVNTVHGHILFTGDFKFDPTPVDGMRTDMKRLEELGEEGVLLLLSDSTNIDRPGWGPSESIVSEALKEVFAEAPGRVLVTMFSSNIHRMQQVADAAKATGRRLAVAGRRMDMTVNMCQSLKYLDIPEGVYTRIDDIGRYRPDQLVILVTGSQGEPAAALSQMSRGEYNRLRLVDGDTILYSARPIPGNEGAIYRTVNNLIHRGANVILEHDRPIHASGHAYQDELKTMVSMTKPFYVAPVHGERRHQRMFEKMLVEMGHAPHRIFTLGNGDALCIDEEKAYVGEGVRAGEVLIDQNGEYVVTQQVLEERFQLAHNGVVVVSAHVDSQDGTLIGRPTLTARGYCGNDEDLDNAREELTASLSKLGPEQILNRPVLEDALTEPVRRAISKFSRQKPVVVPLVTGL